jgi:dihydroorotate dehydrogenase (NAD+) catalytic subunit
MEHTFLGKKISGRFTIPSGIVATNPKTILKIAREVPQIGVLTTKSIGPSPRTGYREPILHQYTPGSFTNAVGLTNPGAIEFAKQLTEIKLLLPKDKFLLISIFGSNANEFVEVAKILEPFADGFELNLSCPHAKGYGMAIGQDPELVREIVGAVKKAVKVPVIPKLTPNTDKIGEIAKAAVEGGADAICAINTVGPKEFTFEGIPILSNKNGGMSGKEVLPIGLKCVKEINEAINGKDIGGHEKAGTSIFGVGEAQGKKIPIIGCGGISTASDVKEYEKAGASIFGIGSALAGMDSNEIQRYFEALEQDLNDTEGKSNNAQSLLKQIDMQFRKFKLVEIEKRAPDIAVLTFDKNIDIRPGQFIFVWVPECGEKPFSALDNEPLKLFVQKKGCLSEKLINLKVGEEIFVRGPYGKAIPVDKNKKTIIVGGGCGIAALYQLAKELGTHDTEVFFGARDKKHLFYIEELMKCSTIWVTTNDGSFGKKGFITEALQKRLTDIELKEKVPRHKIVFYNCGPEAMINAVLPIEEKFVAKEQIFASVEYVTKCGVGICGSCASKTGKRTCVDGPFINTVEKE